MSAYAKTYATGGSQHGLRQVIELSPEKLSKTHSHRSVLCLEPAVSHSGDIHLVPEGQRVDGVLSCQRDAAQKDEEEDDVGKRCGVDDAVTQLTEPGGRN